MTMLPLMVPTPSLHMDGKRMRGNRAMLSRCLGSNSGQLCLEPANLIFQAIGFMAETSFPAQVAILPLRFYLS